MSRIRRIERVSIEDGTGYLTIIFTAGSAQASITLMPPPEWDTWDRTQKVTWSKQQLTDHLTHYNYGTPGEVIYPDLSAPEQAATDFENLPGWATWTAAEAMHAEAQHGDT